ncbi:MAG: hypothetical protein Q8940_21010, partial [Bacteroidota bacterium]|nr:hypothetical protein [Bacteroidota bacterium]
RDVFVYNYNDYLGKGNLKKRFSINEPNYNYYIFGRNDKDVFISEIDGLAHYNGTDTQYLLKYPVTQYMHAGVVLFEKEVFCSFTETRYNGMNMIAHGKLK